MFIQLYEPEIEQYKICEQYNMKYLHYIINQDEYMDMTKDEMINHYTKEKLIEIENEMKEKIKNYIIYKQNVSIDSFGFLDYVVFSQVKYGVDALRQLGYKAHSLETDEYYPQCYATFIHPDGRYISYEDCDGHDFCHVWHQLYKKIK
jgi:hypothetical protein